MRRNSRDMQVNVAGIRRNIKNFAHNYSDAQKKVREVTSNDPWGPNSTLMAEIADLTYNVVAFSEIMQMVWKRLNDDGKNWRHVYKALVLLDYLIKTGSEKVGQQCKENIFAIQTLKDFEYMEDGKDQGQNVREKAKQLDNLLRDEEKLKNERARALKARERFAQSASGFGSDGGLDTPTSPRYPAFRGEWNSRDSDSSAAEIPRDIEIARPQTAGEEELQLQLALAMSREEAEQEEQKRKSDDVRLQLALSQSQQDFKKSQEKIQSHMVDLLDVNLGDGAAPVDPWGMPQTARPQPSQWQQSTSLSSPPKALDPWKPATAALSSASTKVDPWEPSSGVVAATVTSPVNAPRPNHDPWSPVSHSSSDLDEFDIISHRNRPTSPKTNGESTSDPFELNLLGESLPSAGPSPSSGAQKKTPQSFLGENSALVNLDNLVTTSKPSNPTSTANPFSDPTAAPQWRPVFNAQPPKPSINEIKQQSFAQFAATSAPHQQPPAPEGVAPLYAVYDVGATQFPPFSGGGGGAMPLEATPLQTVQDPWTPVPAVPATSTTNLNANGHAPWMMKTNEPAANPFLS
ncbi:epsin-2 isoform X2 [Cylas formicarius]|uniref:epsin-2 isoform X2 n=1 Tax=Cylas formicarius TaxID=197179 RepID=UPI0029586093|nr:epsin-2 isoform X2 [Cylas formicarius]